MKRLPKVCVERVEHIHHNPFFSQHCERIHVQYDEIIVNEGEMAKLNELKDIMAREAAKVSI